MQCRGGRRRGHCRRGGGQRQRCCQNSGQQRQAHDERRGREQRRRWGVLCRPLPTRIGSRLSGSGASESTFGSDQQNSSLQRSRSAITSAKKWAWQRSGQVCCHTLDSSGVASNLQQSSKPLLYLVVGRAGVLEGWWSIQCGQQSYAIFQQASKGPCTPRDPYGYSCHCLARGPAI